MTVKASTLKGGTENYQTPPEGASVATYWQFAEGVPPLGSVGISTAQKTGDFAVQGGLAGADARSVLVKSGKYLMKATPTSESERMFAVSLSADYKCPCAVNSTGATRYDKILLVLPAASLANPPVSGDLTEAACIITERHTAAGEAVTATNAIELAEVTLANSFASIADTVIKDSRKKSISLITAPEWEPLNATLTRTADTTATAPGDFTGKIPVSAKLRWYSNGVLRQNYIAAISYASGTGLTTFTITPGYVTTASDSIFVTGETIWGADYSKALSPVGFPQWFAYTPTITVSGGTAPTYTAEFVTKFSITGRTCDIFASWINTSGGTAGAGSNPIVFTLPASSAINNSNMGDRGIGIYGNGSGLPVVPLVTICTSATTALLQLENAAANVNGANQDNANRRVTFNMRYQI